MKISGNYTSVLISEKAANLFAQIAVKNIVQYTILLKRYGGILIFFNTNAIFTSEIQKLNVMIAEFAYSFLTGHVQEADLLRCLKRLF